MTEMLDSDLLVHQEAFSTPLGQDEFLRLVLDERQEVANRFQKSTTTRIREGFLKKIAIVASLREDATQEVMG